MKVRDIMTAESATHWLSPAKTVAEAVQFLRQHRVRHIPLVDVERHRDGTSLKLLRAIVSERDLLRASPTMRSVYLERKTGPGRLLDQRSKNDADQRQVLTQVCTYKPKTVEPDAPASEAIRTMLAMKIDSLPVTEGEDVRFCGIVTVSDVMRVFVAAVDPDALGPASAHSPAAIVTVGPEQALRDVIALMQAHAIRQLPVVDPAMSVLGLVTDRDVLRLLPALAKATGRRTRGDKFREDLFFVDEDDYASRKILSEPIANAMQQSFCRADADLPLAEVAHRMRQQHADAAVLVTPGGETLAGIVTRTDLLKLFEKRLASAS